MLRSYLGLSRTLLTVCCLLAPAFGLRHASRVHAQDKSIVAAGNAFSRAQQAELTGDFERAAELFELADRIAPTPEALRSATRARMSAGHLATAAGHAEELRRRYPDDQAARVLAEDVLTRAQPELTRYAFDCSEPCTVVIDGLAAGLSPVRTPVVYGAPGVHQLTIGFEGGRSRGLRLSGLAGETRSVQVTPPSTPALASSQGKAKAPETESAAADNAQKRRGLSPGYFWTAAALTVATGGVALWSGLDLLNARDDFKASPTPTRADFEDGERRDRRTTILLATTGGLAVTTIALAVMTNFRGERRPRSAAIGVDRQGAQLWLRSRF